MSNWTIGIPLVPAASLTAAEQFGPSVTVNGASVSGQAASLPGQTMVTLMLQSQRDGLTGLQIYAHSHTQEGATVKLISQLAVTGGAMSWSSQCDNTGALTWFEFPVPAGTKHVRIRIKQVQVQINGPWKIHCLCAMVDGA